MRGRGTPFAIFLAVCLALSGCGSSSSSNIGTPKITSLSPADIPAGEGQFLLSVTGPSINGSSTVNFGTDHIGNGNIITPACGNPPCPSTYQVVIPPSDVNRAGSVDVTVTTSGQTSNTVKFNITSPEVLTVAPVAAATKGPSVLLTLSVLNATPNLEVDFGTTSSKNPPLVPIGPVNCNPDTACEITVTVPASQLATAGPVTLTVNNSQALAGGTATTNFLVSSPPSSTALISGRGSVAGDAASTHSSLSDGGLYLAYDSLASNLGGGSGNGLSQVYLMQTCAGGVSGCTPNTTLISAGSGGAAGSGGVNGSDRPAISADGRFVVFESDDTNLVTGATAAVEQIYLYDSCNSIFGAVQNCTPKLSIASADPSGTPGNAASTDPTISAYGLYIAYQSLATNLLSSSVATTSSQVYLDLTCNGAGGTISGCQPGTQLISRDQNGRPGDNNSTFAALDPAGFSVAYQSLADTLASNVTGNGSQQIYLSTTCLAAVPNLKVGCTPSTVLVSAETGNQPGTSDSVTPSVTDTGGGSFVAYATSAANLLPANASGEQVLGANICLPIPVSTQCQSTGNLLLSRDAGGTPGAGASFHPAVSGTTAVFSSLASLISGATGQQVYAANICFPGVTCSAGTRLVSKDSTGAAIGGDYPASAGGFLSTFSSAGSSASPGIAQIFLAPAAPANPPTPVTRLRRK